MQSPHPQNWTVSAKMRQPVIHCLTTIRYCASEIRETDRARKNATRSNTSAKIATPHPLGMEARHAHGVTPTVRSNRLTGRCSARPHKNIIPGSVTPRSAIFKRRTGLAHATVNAVQHASQVAHVHQQPPLRIASRWASPKKYLRQTRRGYIPQAVPEAGPWAPHPRPSIAAARANAHKNLTSKVLTDSPQTTGLEYCLLLTVAWQHGRKFGGYH